MIIYKATNLINGKVYIGQTVKKLNRRISAHYIDSGKRNSLFCNALRKYKKEDWKWEIIFYAKSKEDLNNLEIFYIKLYNSRDKNIGYNIAFGGQTGAGVFGHTFNRGRKHTPETCEKNRQSKLGKKQSKETIEKRKISLTGRKLSEESKRKIGKGNRGKVRTPEMNEIQRIKKLGKKQKKETIEKRRLKMIGGHHHGRKVIDLLTNIEYKSISLAALDTKISISNIHCQCKGKRHKDNPRFQYAQ